MRIASTGDGRAAPLILATLAMCLVPALSAKAQPPSAANGQALAEKLCTACHIVGHEATSAAVPADVPSFAAIANKPGQTAEAIAGRIVLPHPPMPKVQLTRSEIADLATYIGSLKSP